MKKCILIAMCLLLVLGSFAQETNGKSEKKSKTKSLFMDVHEVGPGKVSFEDVLEAHKKDLATGPGYGVEFMKFWVDEAQGKIYCLATAATAGDLTHAHAKAHGLLPKDVYRVKSSTNESEMAGKDYFLDFHNVGKGKVTADAVAGAHLKDLAIQKKYGVNLINYWLDEKSGVIFCLAQANDSTGLIKTHKEAHGLLPDAVHKVKQGQ